MIFIPFNILYYQKFFTFNHHLFLFLFICIIFEEVEQTKFYRAEYYLAEIFC